MDQIEAVALELDQEKQDAALTIENNRATNFSPGQNGQILDYIKVKDTIIYVVKGDLTNEDTDAIGKN